MNISTQQLQTMPLFLGLSEREIGGILREAHFGMHHYKRGTTIVREGTPCNSLIIIQEGWVEIDTWADNNSYHLTEIVQAPQLIEPDKLFGISPIYHADYRAYTTCEAIFIPKESLRELITKHLIVRINLLNIICRRTQILERIQWQTSSMSLEQRIATFIKQRAHYPAGKKTLYIKMTQLATELNASRLDISNALNAMAEAEKIILKRGIVEVPALQLL